MQQLLHTHFPSLNEVKLMEGIFEYGRFMQLSKDATFSKASGYLKNIPLIISGSLKRIITDDEGNELYTGAVKIGETCGIALAATLFNRLQNTPHLLASENTELIAIPLKNAETWMNEFESWRCFVFKNIHLHYLELMQTLHRQTFQTIEQRLLHHLRQKAAVSNFPILPISHFQLANELNTARVVISRALKYLENEGFVTLYRNRIKILS